MMKSSIATHVRQEIMQKLSAKNVQDLKEETLVEAFQDDEQGFKLANYAAELRNTGELTIPLIYEEFPVEATVEEKSEESSETLPIEEVQAENESIAVDDRKCRICGCTQHDCSQCIEKTGSPCHWVAEDLCSACVEEAKKQDNAKHQPVADAYQEHVQKVLNPSSITFTEMKFFEQLHKAGQGAHLTIDIKEKSGKYTVMLLPKAADQSKIQPILITGTPEELDAEFFLKVGPVLLETGAQLRNVEEHKKSVAAAAGKPDDKKETTKPAEKKSAPAKGAAKKTADKKEDPKKDEKPKVEEPKLF